MAKEKFPKQIPYMKNKGYLKIGYSMEADKI